MKLIEEVSRYEQEERKKSYPFPHYLRLKTPLNEEVYKGCPGNAFQAVGSVAGWVLHMMDTHKWMTVGEICRELQAYHASEGETEADYSLYEIHSALKLLAMAGYVKIL